MNRFQEAFIEHELSGDKNLDIDKDNERLSRLYDDLGWFTKKYEPSLDLEDLSGLINTARIVRLKMEWKS